MDQVYSILPPHLFQPFLDLLFIPWGPDFCLSPGFHPSTPLRSLVAPASPPWLPRAWSNRSPGRLPHLPASATCLSFHTLPGGHTEFLDQACVCHPLPVCPHFSILGLRPDPCYPQEFYRIRVPSSLWLPLLPVRLLPNLQALNDVTVPCPPRRVWGVLFCPPPLEHTSLPPRVTLRLLVSSGFWYLFPEWYHLVFYCLFYTWIKEACHLRVT